MTSMVEVTQADREAADKLAKWLFEVTEGKVNAVAEGDEFQFRQAFARHAEQARMAERERCAGIAEQDRRSELAKQLGHEPAFHRAGQIIANTIRLGESA